MCFDVDHPPSSSTPCLSLAPVLHVCWLRGIFWSLQEKRAALHATVSRSPGPKQSAAGPVSACASQTRLNNLPPFCSSFHILTSQTSKVFGMKLAPSQACASSDLDDFVQSHASFPRAKMFLLSRQLVFISTFQNGNVTKLILSTPSTFLSVFILLFTFSICFRHFFG